MTAADRVSIALDLSPSALRTRRISSGRNPERAAPESYMRRVMRLGGNAVPPGSVCQIARISIASRWREVTVLVCDYNGWADAPEEEREALDGLDFGPASQTERRRQPRAPAPTASPDSHQIGA